MSYAKLAGRVLDHVTVDWRNQHLLIEFLPPAAIRAEGLSRVETVAGAGAAIVSAVEASRGALDGRARLEIAIADGAFLRAEAASFDVQIAELGG